MLWTKSWLETRWRFLIGLGLLICSAAASVLTYPQLVKLLPLVPTNVGGPLGERIREAAQLSSTYNGFLWSHWFRQNLAQGLTLFAVLLGTGSFFSESGGVLFTLSLPVSRRRLLAVRAGAGLAELFVLALIPSMFVPILSPAIGQHFSVAGTIVYALCAFVAASVFFGFTFFLSTVFTDIWRPLLITLALAFLLSIIDQALWSPIWSIYAVMSAKTYFQTGHLPWIGLLASAAVSALLYYGAVMNIARRDF